MRTELFRQQALDELSSPEQLDQAILVTSPLRWLLTFFVFFFVTALTLWASFGTIQTRVNGPAFIVFEDARSNQIVATGSGRIVDLDIRPGDRVEQGQLVARMENRGARRRLEEAERLLSELEDRSVQLAATRSDEMAEFLRLRERRTEELDKRVAQGQQLVETLTRRLRDAEGLLARGFVSNQTVDTRRSELFRASQDLEATRSGLTQLDLERDERANQWNARIADAEKEVSQQRARVRELQIEAEEAEALHSPLSGEVVQVLSSEGSLLQPGTPIAIVVNAGSRLSTLGFFPASQAKSVKAGMAVQISPSTVKKEEFGSLVGRVVDVSRFPLSGDALLTILQNQDLVREFTKQGPPLLIKMEMVRDDTGEHYEWTSGNAPPIEVTAGTIGEAAIITREQPPATLVIPALKSFLGMV